MDLPDRDSEASSSALNGLFQETSEECSASDDSSLHDVEAAQVSSQSEAPKTKVYFCSNQDLSDLPGVLCTMVYLEYLDCSANKIAGLRVIHPEDGPREDLHNYWPMLRVLNCSTNLLSDLPEELGRLAGLEELYLNYNRFEELPDAVYELSSLRKLECEGNNLKRLSENIRRLQLLVHFTCADNCMTSLPYGIRELVDLEYFNCSHNKLTEIHGSLAQRRRTSPSIQSESGTMMISPHTWPTLQGTMTLWPKLKVLKCSSNELTNLTSELGNLSSLTELDFSLNRINVLPEYLFKLKALKTLNCSRNGIASLPGKIKLLTALENLDCSSNKLDSLPFRGESMNNLKKLNCSMNLLRNLPKDVKKLVNLEVLDCSHNRITTLPKTLGKLLRLKELDCEFNNIKELFGEVAFVGLYRDGRRLNFANNPVLDEYLQLIEGKLPQLAKGVEISSQGEVKLIVRDAPNSNLKVSCGRDKTVFLKRSYNGEIDFSECRLQHVPTTVFEFKEVTKLNFQDSALVTIPSEIGTCQHLKELDLTNNDALRGFPSDLKKCDNLEVVRVQGCTYATNLFESLDRHIKSEGRMVKWEGKPPSLPKVFVKFLVCATLLSMSLFVIAKLVWPPQPKSCDQLCQPESLAKVPFLNDSEACTPLCNQWDYFHKLEGNSMDLYVFQRVVAVVSIVLLLPHIADVGNMMDQRIRCSSLEKERPYSLLNIQTELEQRIDLPQVFYYNIFGILSALSNCFCCFVCIRPWKIGVDPRRSQQIRPENPLFVFCMETDDKLRNDPDPCCTCESYYEVYQWHTGCIADALALVFKIEKKSLKLELDYPELLCSSYVKEHKELYGREPARPGALASLLRGILKLVGCLLVLTLGSIVAVVVLPVNRAWINRVWLCVVVTEWVDTVQSLLLIPLSWVVITHSDSFGDVIVNLVAVSAFARLDDEVVELFMKPQQSLVERWRLYTGSNEDLANSGVLRVHRQ